MKTTRKLHFALPCILVTLLTSGCLTIFSEMQSARMAGPGRFEITPSYSRIWSSESSNEELTDNLGVRTGVGVSDTVDLRFRFEHVFLDEGDGWNLVGFGPKFRLLKDHIALSVPFGLAFGEDIDTEDSFEVQPTVIFTVPMDKGLEFNTSGKLIVFLDDDLEQDERIWAAVNIGFGISTDLEKYVVRPEIGFFFDPNPEREGHFYHMSVGITYYLGEKKESAK